MSKRRHHYIPEVLCKRFTNDWRNLYRIDCTKSNAIAIPISIKDAFVQKDLNTMNLAGEKNTDFIEDFLDKQYERTFGKSMYKIYKILFNNAKDEIFEPKDYDNILYFCILSYLRTPRRLREIHIQTLRRSYLLSIFAKSDLELPKIDVDYILTKTLFDGVNILKKYLQGITLRIAYHTFDDEYFLLTDLPIALVNSNDKEFASPDLDIVFPVGKNVVLIFSKSEKHGDITYIKKRETIENINKQLCMHFTKYIACADKKYLEDFVARHHIMPEPLPDIEDIEAEKDKIINGIRDELKKNPVGRYIRINRNGIEFLN